MAAVRRTSAHLRRKHPITVWRRAVGSLLKCGRRGAVYCKVSAKHLERLKERFGDGERLGQLSGRVECGTARTFFAIVMMRAMRMPFRVVVWVVGFAVAVFSVVRVAVVGGGVVMSVFFGGTGRFMVVEPEQVLDAAIGTRQQPKRHRDRRSDAEGKMEFWPTGNHTFSSLLIV